MTSWRGQDAAIATLNRELVGAVSHHAWLFAGPEGVGKAGIAQSFAAAFIAGGGHPIGAAPVVDSATARMIADGTHPDCITLRRLDKVDPKDEGEGVRAKHITAAQVRGLGRTLAYAPTLSDRRVIIIDAADDMDRFAANALLKNLEEPPASTIFIVIAHASARLLPTIRSRCRVVRFAPVDDAGVAAILAACCPDASEADREAATRHASGSPGLAVALCEAGFGDVARLLDHAQREGDDRGLIRAAMLPLLTGKANRQRYALFLGRAAALVADQARQANSVANANHHAALWRQAAMLADDAMALNLDTPATIWQLVSIIATLGKGVNAG